MCLSVCHIFSLEFFLVLKSFNGVSRIFKESFKGVYSKFQGCFKEVYRMFWVTGQQPLFCYRLAKIFMILFLSSIADCIVHISMEPARWNIVIISQRNKKTMKLDNLLILYTVKVCVRWLAQR